MKLPLFFGSAAVTLALLIACNAGSGEEILGGYAAPHTPPPEGSYIISIFVTDVEGQGSAYASIENADKERFDDITTANAKDTVILTVIPPVITETEDSGEGGDSVYYFVAPITGYYEGKDGTPKTYNAFKRSADVSNEYTFPMPAGNVTVNVSFTTTVDETSAFLRWFGVSAGSYTVNPQDPFEYTVIVPYDYDSTVESGEESDEGFYIYGQAENQDATLELLQGNPGTGGDLSGQALTLAEGLNNYTISVTSQDGNTTNQYHIKVIKLPDLTLKTFKIKKGGEFERDLAQQDAQDVYVTDREGLVITAESSDTSASVSQSPTPVPTLKENPEVSTDVTVTVSKNLSGVPEEYTTKSYALKLHYANTDLTPIAEGGYVSFIPDGDTGAFYEVHRFETVGTYPLALDPLTPSVSADYLIVAGGGGAGGSLWFGGGGGGGAGGLLYKTGETLPLSGGSVSITVGAGGKGGGKNKYGGDGNPSAIGSITVPGGGGGGPGIDSFDAASGRPGGSGGGGGAGYGGARSGGAATAAGGVLGYAGGRGRTGNVYAGGGGGGAGGAGGDNNSNVGGAGGNPWSPDDSSAWVTGAAGVSGFSRGGKGGNRSSSNGTAGAYYGDGGSGGGAQESGGGVNGGNGCRGIVIIRFRRP
jgi:hypothetical protein